MGLDHYVTGGHAVDLILAFMAGEFLLLAWRRGFRARAMVDLLLALAPGACLVLALRAALTGAGWIWVAAALAASLPFHLADMARRR